MSQYLAIKSWDVDQPARNGKHSSWIKDYTEKESDPAYGSLSCFQRYIIDGLQRIHGRLGHNIPNDPRYICNALHVIASDRPRVRHALATCIERGLLILTDQEDTISFHKKEKEKREEKPSAPAPPRGPVNNSKHAKMTAETRHTRLREMVKLWYQEWAGQECPWDGSEAKQLDSMLKSTPNWMDSQFVGCLVNLSLSECIPKGDRPREWLGRLPKFLHGPLDRFWKPMVARTNGHADKTSDFKAEGRGEQWDPGELARAQEEHRRKYGNSRDT